jgi:hypothetical protein
MAPTPANMYADILRHDLCAFTHRSFLELNPREEFLCNWHIERLAAKLEEVQAPHRKRTASSSQIASRIGRLSSLVTGA